LFERIQIKRKIFKVSHIIHARAITAADIKNTARENRILMIKEALISLAMPMSIPTVKPSMIKTCKVSFIKYHHYFPKDIKILFLFLCQPLTILIK